MDRSMKHQVRQLQEGMETQGLCQMQSSMLANALFCAVSVKVDQNHGDVTDLCPLSRLTVLGNELEGTTTSTHDCSRKVCIHSRAIVYSARILWKPWAGKCQ